MSNGQMPLSEWEKIPFADDGEMIAALGSARYRDLYSSAYREACAKKLAISTTTGTNNIRVGGVEHSIGIGTGALTGESPAEDQTELSRAYAASRPDQPMAVNQNKISQ